jgi:hypothetical protein
MARLIREYIQLLEVLSSPDKLMRLLQQNNIQLHEASTPDKLLRRKQEKIFSVLFGINNTLRDLAEDLKRTVLGEGRK